MDDIKRNTIIAALRFWQQLNPGQTHGWDGEQVLSTEGIDDLIDEVLKANDQVNVLITTRGGISDYVFEGNAEIRTFDFDDYHDAPEDFDNHLPAHFDDLAKAMKVPGRVVSPLTAEYSHVYQPEDTQLRLM